MVPSPRQQCLDKIMQLPPRLRAGAYIKLVECESKLDAQRGSLPALFSTASYRDKISADRAEGRVRRRERQTEAIDRFIAEATTQQEFDIIDRVVALLSAIPQGNLLIERFYLNRSDAELARVHGLTEAAVRKRISRARAAARRVMAS